MSNLKIGFVDSFPPRKGTEVFSDVFSEIQVTLQKGDFAEGRYWCYTIETSVVDLGTFERSAEVMKKAGEKFAKEYKITICREVCNWPLYRAVVTHIDHLLTEEQIAFNERDCEEIRERDYRERGQLSSKKFGF